MVQNKEKIKKYEGLIVNIFWCILCIILVSPVYDNSDDHLMNLLLFGGKGTSTPDVVFINIILSKVLYCFDKFLPIVNWMSVLEIILVCVFFVITSDLIRKSSSSRILTYSYIGLVSPYFYSHITFSVAAILGGFAGALLIITELKQEEIRKKYLTIGIVILFISTMLREMAITGTVLFLVLPFGECVYHYRRRIGLLKKKGAIILSIVVGLLLIRSINQYYYGNWDTYYTKINSARAAVSDYSLAEWKDVKNELEKKGITENDYSLIQAKIFDDYEYFDADQLQRIAKIANEKVQKQKIGGELLKDFSERKIWDTTLLIVCTLIVLTLGQRKNKRKLLAKIVFIWLCLGIYTIYLYYFVDRFPRYVKDGFCAIVIALMMYEFAQYYTTKVCISFRKSLAFLLMFCLAMSNVNYEWIWKAINHVEYKEIGYRDFFSEISRRKDEFYYADVVDYFSEIYMKAFSVFEPIEKDIYNNYLRLSIWDREHPVTNVQLAEHGMKNPFLDLLKENVYFMSDTETLHYKLLQNYWKEHLQKEVSYSLVEEFSGNKNIQIFKFQENFETYDSTTDGNVIVDSVETKGTEKNWISFNIILQNCSENFEKIYLELQTGIEKQTFMCERSYQKINDAYRIQCTIPEEMLSTGKYSLGLVLENQQGQIIQVSNNTMLEF